MSQQNKPTDSDLIQLFWSGNENAFNQLMQRHEESLKLFVLGKSHDPILTKDIVQDAFMKAFINLKQKKYNEEGNFKAWIMRIAFNLFIDSTRKKAKKNTISLSFLIKNGSTTTLEDVIKGSAKSPEEILIDTEVDVDLGALIERLPEDQNTVLVLRLYQNFSFKEIADFMGGSINTALGRMRYAIVNIKKFIDEEKTKVA